MSSDPYIPQSDRPDVDFSELLEIHARTVNGKMSVGMVGRVQTFDPDSNTCSVKPVTQARFQNGDVAELPVLPRVPVKFPQGGGFQITWPLQRGDDVWLDFGERSLEEWKTTNSGNYAPRNKRRFDLSDATAYAGLSSPADPLDMPGDCMVVGSKVSTGMRIKIGPATIELGTGALGLLNILQIAFGALATGFSAVGTGFSAVATYGPLASAAWGSITPAGGAGPATVAAGAGATALGTAAGVAATACSTAATAMTTAQTNINTIRKA